MLWTSAHQTSLSFIIFQSLCPLSWWCYVTISSSAAHFSFCLQAFSASGSFPMSHLFKSGGQSVGASASASFLPTNIQSWFPLGLIVLTSLQSKGLSRVFSSTTVWKHQFFSTQSSTVQLLHLYRTTGKTMTLTILTFVGKVVSLFFNTLSSFVINFLEGSSIF